MKKWNLNVLAVAMVILLSACSGGNGNTSNTNVSNAPLQNSPNSAPEQNNVEAPPTPKTPTFSGDTIQLFGLEWEEALNLMGDGSTTNSSDFISNSKAGIEASLTNTTEDMKRHTVFQVCLKGNKDISFHGIQVGDTLKEVDTLLMGEGANYTGELKWYININEMPYEIRLTTSDNKTIDSIEASTSEMADYYITDAQDEQPSNPFAFTEDMHTIEPIYWE